jgi:hypothetical protein
MYRNAWAGVDRTTLDVSEKADIVCDLNKIPLPAIPGQYDTATCFNCLEHLKHPALVLEWINADELWLTMPTSTSWIAQRGDIKLAAQNGEQPHFFGFNPVLTRSLLDSCGWTVMSCEYIYDYQSWRGQAFANIVSFAPYFLSMCFFMRCLRK